MIISSFFSDQNRTWRSRRESNDNLREVTAMGLGQHTSYIMILCLGDKTGPNNEHIEVSRLF